MPMERPTARKLGFGDAAAAARLDVRGTVLTIHILKPTRRTVTKIERVVSCSARESVP